MGRAARETSPLFRDVLGGWEPVAPVQGRQIRKRNEKEKVKMPKKELIDIAGEIKAETEKAYRFYDGKNTVWLPKSQCQWDQDDKAMTMPEWLATEKELI